MMYTIFRECRGCSAPQAVVDVGIKFYPFSSSIGRATVFLFGNSLNDYLLKHYL